MREKKTRKGVGRGMKIKIILLLFSFFLSPNPFGTEYPSLNPDNRQLKPMAKKFLFSSGSSSLQILSAQTAAPFLFPGEITAYIAARRGFERQRQLQGQWVFGGQLCHVLEAREPLREHRKVTRVWRWADRQHLSDIHSPVKMYCS